MEYEKLPITGPHIKMSHEELNHWYEVIETEHNKYLKQYHIRLPKKESSKGLWLIYLRKYMGKLVHKDTISFFVKTIIKTAGQDQQVRHLGADGFYVLNRGEKLQNSEQKVLSGYHILITLENPRPDHVFKQLKRIGRVGAKDFNDLKAVYDFKCATCGAEEGKPHRYFPQTKVSLQQGHQDPNKALDLDNTIPQCQLCNSYYLDRFIFDNNGRVKDINPHSTLGESNT